MGGTTHERGNSRRGITLPELLVVVSVIGMAIAVAVPLVSGAIVSAQLRTGTDQFRVSLQAARMIAVSQQAPADVRIFAHPDNRYEYEDVRGKTRVSRIPPGVCIQTATASTITFGANGAIADAATTIFTTTHVVGVTQVCDLSGGVDSFSVETSLLGQSSVTRNFYE
jgi:type IV fimbrial biogenesis protein FimT